MRLTKEREQEIRQFHLFATEELLAEIDALRAELRRVKDAKAEELKIADVIEENVQLRAALEDARNQLINRQMEYCFAIENDWREPQHSK